MVTSNIIIENASIGFRNFSGKGSTYNKEGSRNFTVFLDTKLAKNLEKDGWHIKWLKPRTEDEEPQALLTVSVNYSNIPPKIMIVKPAGNVKLDESNVGELDWADISKVDLIIRPYNWEMNGKKGVKAYLKTMYITIQEDEFEKKYGQQQLDLQFPQDEYNSSSSIKSDTLPF